MPSLINDSIYFHSKQLNDFDAIKHASFFLVNLEQLRVNSIQNVLSKVESLELTIYKFDRFTLSAIIAACVNLKRLSIIQYSHSTLQQLICKSIDNYLSNTELLERFLEQSPTIRSLDILSAVLWMIQNAKIQLDDLVIHLVADYDDIIR